ncbi:MAG TPA: ATP-binding protein [Nocardioidaceae bacterium]|nr:ATP-binding protein [Nocardioidaceae bacterium]
MADSQPSTPVTMRLPFEASSVPVARQGLKSFLGGVGGSENSVEDARVVISELVANSVRHARPLSDGGLQVSWVLEGGGLQVSVTDGGGRSRPRRVSASASALAGRGMAIVDVLSEEWWSERTEGRCTVHAVLHV